MSKRNLSSGGDRPSKKAKGFFRTVAPAVSQTTTRHIHLKDTPSGRLSQKRVDKPSVLPPVEPDDEVDAWINEPEDENPGDVAANQVPRKKSKSKATWVCVDIIYALQHF